MNGNIYVDMFSSLLLITFTASHQLQMARRLLNGASGNLT